MRTAKKKSPGAAGAGRPSRSPKSGFLLDIAGGVVEQRTEVRTHEAGTRNDGNADERGNQAVFNSRGAGLVLGKTGEKRGHDNSPCFWSLARSPLRRLLRSSPWDWQHVWARTP